jgi:hypothetical protein
LAEAHFFGLGDHGRIPPMRAKPEAKSKLTDAERHKRFVETARKVEASGDPKDFEKAFKRVTLAKRSERQK